MSSSNDLNTIFDNFLGDILDKFVVFASGADPELLYNKVSELTKTNGFNFLKHFYGACIIASVAQRNTVKEFLKQGDSSYASKVILEAFSIKGELNVSELSLIGHCIIAATSNTKNKLIIAFRDRIKGENIWDIGRRDVRVSEKQLEIFREKALRFDLNKAKEFGKKMLELTVKAMQSEAKSGSGKSSGRRRFEREDSESEVEGDTKSVFDYSSHDELEDFKTNILGMPKKFSLDSVTVDDLINLAQHGYPSGARKLFNVMKDRKAGKDPVFTSRQQEIEEVLSRAPDGNSSDKMFEAIIPPGTDKKAEKKLRKEARDANFERMLAAVRK